MRINDEIRDKIREDYATGKYSYASLGAKYGVSGTSIGRIVNPEYQERERAASRLRQRTYDQPKAEYAFSLRFSKKEQPLIDKLKAVYNKQQYIKDLIAADIEKEKN